MVTDTEAVHNLTQAQYNPPWVNFVCSVSGGGGLWSESHWFIQLTVLQQTITCDHDVSSSVRTSSWTVFPLGFSEKQQPYLLFFCMSPVHCDIMPRASVQLGRGHSLGLTGCRQLQLDTWHTVSMQQTVRLQHCTLRSSLVWRVKEQNLVYIVYFCSVLSFSSCCTCTVVMSAPSLDCRKADFGCKTSSSCNNEIG